MFLFPLCVWTFSVVIDELTPGENDFLINKKKYLNKLLLKLYKQTLKIKNFVAKRKRIH